MRQILRFCPTTKVAIFSVHDSEQTRQEIRAAGAHGFVSKGKEGDDRLRLVRDALERNTLAIRRLRPNRVRHLRANRRNPRAKVTIIFSLIY